MINEKRILSKIEATKKLLVTSRKRELTFEKEKMNERKQVKRI